MNHIDSMRAELQRVYDVSAFVNDSEEVIFSPTGHFRLETANYFVPKTFGDWELTKITILYHNTNEAVFTFFSNHEKFIYSWAVKDGREYLICAEDIFGGQTIIDLTNRMMAGYSPNEDGFIWTDHYLSPDGAILATIGCYWACPYVIKLYDFSQPLQLPLREVREIQLLDSGETITGWLDNTSIKTLRRILYI